jgi:hypothetical protein
MLRFGAFRCQVPCSDFKSSASAIPPPGRWLYKFNQRARFLQDSNLEHTTSKICYEFSTFACWICPFLRKTKNQVSARLRKNPSRCSTPSYSRYIRR